MSRDKKNLSVVWDTIGSGGSLGAIGNQLQIIVSKTNKQTPKPSVARTLDVFQETVEIRIFFFVKVSQFLIVGVHLIKKNS